MPTAQSEHPILFFLKPEEDAMSSTEKEMNFGPAPHRSGGLMEFVTFWVNCIRVQSDICCGDWAHVLSLFPYTSS